MFVATPLAPILELKSISKRFGGLQVLKSIDLAIVPGERCAIIGPNGAGKTTLFNIICGQLRPTSGEVRFRGVPTNRKSPDWVARSGLARTFQRNALFDNLTVAENVCLAVQQRRGLGHTVARSVGAYGDLVKDVGEVLGAIGLDERRDVTVKELSYGEQRQLELAIALAMKPHALLLDEPTAGMSPAETSRMIGIIGGLPREVTIVIIEHDMDVVFSVATRVSVLDHGVVLADGAPEEIQRNVEVQEAYLGEAAIEEGR